MKVRIIVIAVLAVVGDMRAGVAQERSLTIGAGPIAYDASGTGSTYTVTVRALWPGGKVFALQPGVGYAAVDEVGPTVMTRLAFIDVAVRVNPFRTKQLSPFVGFGPAAALYLNNRFGRSSPSLGYAATAGLDVRLSARTTITVDARYRGWELNSMTPVYFALELTLGVGVAF